MAEQRSGASTTLATSDTTDPEAPFSVGHYLKSQRVLRGIGIEELSLRTRIPLRSIERLEAGAFDGEPDGFVRGFVRTISEGLGLDPDDTLVRMLEEPTSVGRRGMSLGLPPRIWGVLVGLVIGLVGILGVAQFALMRAAAPVAAAEDEAILRRDPVRALAEAQAASSPFTPVAPVEVPEVRAADDGTPDDAAKLPAVSAPVSPR